VGNQRPWFRDGKSSARKGELGLVFPNGTGGLENHGDLLSRVFWPIQIAACVVVMKDGLDDEGRPLKVPDAKYSLQRYTAPPWRSGLSKDSARSEFKC
jgi:hypothetical protein